MQSPNSVSMVKAMLCAFMLTGVVQGAHALPPKHEMNRLLLSAEKELAAENWDKAQVTLERLGQLGVEPPDVFQFYMGQVLTQQKQYEKALPFLESYIVKTGEEGEHYKTALMLLTEGEEYLASQQKIKPSSSISYTTRGKAKSTNLPDQPFEPGHGATSDKGQDEYLVSLRRLYLTDSDQKALLLHINQLLGSHPYYGDKIKKQQRDAGVDTQLDVAPDRELIIQERHYGKGGASHINVVKQAVFGIDPIVRYGCNMGESICWLYHPINTHERWILLDRDDVAASELALAVSRLIRLLQK